MNTNVQYLGFSVVTTGRVYSFRVMGKDVEDRSFTVMIANAAFLPGRLKYQEGPDISYRKLLTALAAEQSDARIGVRQQVTESEVNEYSAAGKNKARIPTREQRLALQQRFNARLQR